MNTYLTKENITTMIFELKEATAKSQDANLFANVSFCASPGDAVAVVGENAARKAVLMAMLGLQPLSAGWASVDGEPITAITGAYFRRFIAYLPDTFDFEGMTVQMVAKSQFAIRSNSDYVYSSKAVAEELARLGVDKECMTQRFDALPSAVAQRAALALSGMFERPLLLLDNPTSYQDDAGRQRVSQYIAALRQIGTAVVVSTADEALRAMCNKTVNL